MSDLDLYALYALCGFRCEECRRGGERPAHLVVRGVDGAPDRMLCGEWSGDAVILDESAPSVGQVVP